MKKILFTFICAFGVLQAADILQLVSILDRNDTSAFEQNVQTAIDANAMRDVV